MRSTETCIIIPSYRRTASFSYPRADAVYAWLCASLDAGMPVDSMAYG